MEEIKKLKGLCEDNHIYIQDEEFEEGVDLSEEELDSDEEYNQIMNEKFIQKMNEINQDN